MSLANSTDREAGEGRLGAGSCFFPCTAGLTAVVHINRQVKLMAANLFTEYFSVLSPSFK